ncbi:MAG TPA: TIGR00730 family Rossman fold protein [Anaerolineales bacterium]|nr:TIGR00730 family Rossman fold protein [Anaerolineales bacterium]
MAIATICVYCGSADHLHPEYLDSARRMGEVIAMRKIRLVFGAGATGLMGAVADGALEAGGEVTGVIPEYFNTPQLCHPRLTHLEVVETIHLRKARMAELADAFIALPGGFGTFEEFFEILTWAQIGLHQKPIGLLNVRGYFNPLLNMIDHARDEGFIYNEHSTLFVHTRQPEDLLTALEKFESPGGLDRWLLRPDENSLASQP